MWGDWGGITLGEMPDVGDRGWWGGDGDSKTQWHVCTYATVLQDAGCAHVPQSLKYNKEINKIF